MAAGDAKPVPVKNQAFRFTFAIRKADGSLVTTWADMDSEISKDQEAFADCTSEAIEIGTSGIGYLDLSAAETNCNNFVIKVSVSNADAVLPDFHFYPTTGSDIPVNMFAVSGDTTAADNLELQYDGTGLTGNTYPATQAELAATSSTANDIFNAVDARLPGTLSSGRVRAQVEGMGANVMTASALASDAVAEIADAVLEESIADHYGVPLSLAAYINSFNSQFINMTARIGAWTGTGVNTVLGAFKALLSKTATVPSDIGGTFDPATDSTEAIRDRGDAAWVTGGGASVQNIFEADPADYDADADSFAARVLAILAKANQITGPFAYKGPVSATGRVTIYQGKDYNSNDGTALEWTSDSALTGLDAVGASVSFDINGDQYAGVVSGSVGAWTIRVNLTAAQTAALPVGDSPYELTAVLASGRTPPPLAVGTVTVKAEV